MCHSAISQLSPAARAGASPGSRHFQMGGRGTQVALDMDSKTEPPRLARTGSI